jgi:outer membrane protein OmpA-like peptidoglycan-associated protein
MKLSDTIGLVLKSKEENRALSVTPDQSVYEAIEKMAEHGILLAYPGLNIEVGGYTDNVGGDEMNQTLSENRARSVRD